MEIYLESKNLIFGAGIILKPSSFLEQLDFVDSPNLRIQIYKFNVYLFVGGKKKWKERNKEKVTLAASAYKEGYMTAMLLGMGEVKGKA